LPDVRSGEHQSPTVAQSAANPSPDPKHMQSARESWIARRCSSPETEPTNCDNKQPETSLKPDVASTVPVVRLFVQVVLVHDIQPVLHLNTSKLSRMTSRNLRCFMYLYLRWQAYETRFELRQQSRSGRSWTKLSWNEVIHLDHRKARRSHLRSHSTHRRRRNQASQASIRRQEPSRQTTTADNQTQSLPSSQRRQHMSRHNDRLASYG
jgi:hypothetical protein